MRCTFIIRHINEAGGTERSTCAVMNGLAQQGHTIRLLELTSRGPSPFPLHPSIQSRSLFSRKVKIIGSWPRIVLRLARDLKRNTTETLIIVEASHALYGIPAAKLAGCRCIVWEHFNFRTTLNQIIRPLSRRLAARFANDIITLTHRDRTFWQTATRPRAALTVIPNMAPPVSPAPYNPNARTVLAAGRLTRQKGFDLLLNAWRHVEADPRSTGWSLLIRGEGPEHTSLTTLLKPLRHATLAPVTSDMTTEYTRAGLYVCSSRYEGLPMVILEALSAGLPVVSFDCETGPAELIEHGKTGLLTPPENPEALAEALLTLMASDDTRRTMSITARHKAETFQPPAIIARWMALLSRKMT